MVNIENRSSEYALELQEINKVYEGPPIVKALSDVSLTVNHGELLGIIGSSGSGKTTLLHIMGTLSTPSSGSISIDGTNVLFSDITWSRPGDYVLLKAQKDLV